MANEVEPGLIKVWMRETGKEVAVFDRRPQFIVSYDFVPGTEKVAIVWRLPAKDGERWSRQQIDVVEVGTKQIPTTVVTAPSGILNWTISGNGRRLAWTDGRDRYIHVHSLDTDKEIARLETDYPDCTMTLALNGDGTRVVWYRWVIFSDRAAPALMQVVKDGAIATQGSPFNPFMLNNTLCTVQNVEDGAIVAKLSNPTKSLSFIDRLAFTPDGRLVLGRCNWNPGKGRGVLCWDVATEKFVPLFFGDVLADGISRAGEIAIRRPNDLGVMRSGT